MASGQPTDAATALGLRGRLGVAGCVLLAEYLLVSLRFDALTVVDRGGIWAWVGRVGAVAPLAVVALTALVLLRGRASSPLGAVPDAVPEKPSRLLVGLHALLFVAFFAVTAHVFGTEAAPAGSAAGWLALFAVLAVAMALALLVGMAGPGVVVRAASWSALAALGIGFLAWLAGQFTTELWSALAELTLFVAASMLRPFVTGLHVDLSNTTLALEDFEVHVSGECSGLEGVGLIAVLLAAYLVAFRERLRMPNALLLLPIGVLAAWFGNSFRIAVLMVVGAYVDPELAYGGFHSKLGWVLFCAVALGVAALAQRTPFFRPTPEGESDDYENPTAGFLMPALALNAVALVTTMFAYDIDRYYGLRLLAAGIALVAYRRYYRDLPRGGSPLAVVAGLAIGVLWVATAPGGGEPVPLGNDWFWIVTRTLGSIAVVPVVEELAFRGCLLRWLVSRDFTSVPLTKWTPWAILGSSLAFGVLHERWLAATIVGVAYAALQLRRGRIVDAMLAHAATNAVVSAAALWSGNVALWS